MSLRHLRSSLPELRAHTSMDSLIFTDVSVGDFLSFFVTNLPLSIFVLAV